MDIFFIVSILIIVFSGAGMLYLLLSRFQMVKAMDEKEFFHKLKESRSVFSDFYYHAVVPAGNFWHTIILPKIYHGVEKIISWFRIYVLKVEARLLNLTNYIRGKREIHNNGKHSPYWKGMNDFKNKLNEKNKKDN